MQGADGEGGNIGCGEHLHSEARGLHFGFGAHDDVFACATALCAFRAQEVGRGTEFGGRVYVACGERLCGALLGGGCPCPAFFAEAEDGGGFGGGVGDGMEAL